MPRKRGYDEPDVGHYVYSQIFVEMVLHLMPYRQADGGVYGMLLRYSRLLSAKDPRF